MYSNYEFYLLYQIKLGNMEFYLVYQIKLWEIEFLFGIPKIISMNPMTVPQDYSGITHLTLRQILLKEDLYFGFDRDEV